MRKIPTLYVRDFDHDHGRYVTHDVTPGCEWVLAGEGIATRKFDGVCVRIDADAKVWSRREVKPGAQAPVDFEAIQTDPETGKTVGWEPYENSTFMRYIDLGLTGTEFLPPGTYELIGPKINGNPENSDLYRLIPHGIQVVHVERDYDSIRALLATVRVSLGSIDGEADRVERPEQRWEGLVFWRSPGDIAGDMAKIKARDFR